jgi:hypothetical protein
MLQSDRNLTYLNSVGLLQRYDRGASFVAEKTVEFAEAIFSL